jgi:hypothetical protein
MDRHEFSGLTATDAANMHLKDMAIQDRFGVQLLTYWFDYDRQTAFCLASAPTADAVSALHAESHGGVPTQVIEVDERVVERFMGGISAHELGEPYVETAFRTILFTDLESSTTLTQTIGDARAMALLRRHDEIIRDAVQRHGGSEVKHTETGSWPPSRQCQAQSTARCKSSAGSPARMRPTSRFGSESGWPPVSR